MTASAPARAPTLRSPALLTGLLALLTAVGPISTDMYLPAFPAMRHALHAAAGQAQLTLTAWFLGLGIGQLAHGQLADRYGRRVPLLFGTALYTLGSAGCACSNGMTVLSCWRFVAALGAAASLIIPRAIIADTSATSRDAARTVGRMITVMGVVPALAPSAGALITAHAGWRVIFALATGYGLLCSALIMVVLPETASREHGAGSLIGTAVARYGGVWRGPVFRLHALQGGFATFTQFAFLGGAPSVFLEHYGLSPTVFGGVFVLTAIGFVVGIRLNVRVVDRVGTGRALTIGTVMLSAACGVMLLIAIAGAGAAGLAVGMAAASLSLGLVLPGAALGSVLEHPGAVGVASALYGTVVFLVGAASTVMLGIVPSDGPLSMTLLMLAGAVAALACDRVRPASPK